MTADNTQTGRSILCIEDEYFISELYERALKKAGYKVSVIADGLAALEAARTGEYDIILLDLMIPNLNGVDILRDLRSTDKPNVSSKIIIITNLEQREDVRSDIEAQADGYLVKAELTPRELVDFINSVD